MRIVIGVGEKVRVIGGDDGQAKFGAEGEDLFVEPRLSGGVVCLDFEVVAILEDLRVPGGGGAGLIPPVVLQVCGDLAGKTGGAHDQAFGVLRQQFAVHAGARVEAFGVCERRQFDEILVTDAVAGE